MFDINEALADVVARASEPALAAIKLAWWRDRLEQLDQGSIPAEPRLQTAASGLLTRAIRGAELAELAIGWAALLQSPPETMPFEEGGIRLFRLGLRLLDAELDEQSVGAAGRLLITAAARRRGILEKGASATVPEWPRMPRRARPLTALVVLAARDLKHGGPPFEPEGTPARAATLLRHRLTGRI